MRSILALSLLALVACSHDNPSEPPAPPAPKVARVVLADTAPLALTRSTVALPRLVLRAYDAKGTLLPPDTKIYFQTPPGWQRSGNVLTLPAYESRVTIRLTADSVAGPQRAASLAAGDTSTALDTTLSLTVGLNLRSYAWRADWTCVVKDGALHTSDDIVVDSLVYSGTVDTVAYAGDSLFFNAWANSGHSFAQAVWSGTRTDYLRDGTTRVNVRSHEPFVTFVRQAPDTLWVFKETFAGNPNGDGQNWPMVRQVTADTSARVYTGHAWCEHPDAIMTDATRGRFSTR